jgi:UPF0042 nucleotide-binding protein
MSLRPVIIVTGYSGAGQSTSLKILEDLGYEALDNLPLFLLPALVRQGELMDSPLAVRIDTRTRGFTAQALLQEMASLRADPAVAARLLFIECDDDILQRRFTETRRRHPLAIERPVSDGIRRERQLLAGLIEAADLIIDTSQLSIHDLKRRLAGEFRLDDTLPLQISLMSFSYKHGLPREADLVFDVRFLRNPHYNEALEPLTGRDPEIAAYIEDDPEFDGFFTRLKAFLIPLLPRFRAEGKSYLTIAFGCTGGKHRSVFVAEHLGQALAETGSGVIITHRDLEIIR